VVIQANCSIELIKPVEQWSNIDRGT
jgi:hypothetical protein